MAAIEPPEIPDIEMPEVEWKKTLDSLNEKIQPNGKKTLKLLHEYNKKFGEMETQISLIIEEIELLDQTLGQKHKPADIKDITDSLKKAKDNLKAEYEKFRAFQLIKNVESVRQYMLGNVSAIDLMPIIQPLKDGPDIIKEIRWPFNSALRDGANNFLDGFVKRFDNIKKQVSKLDNDIVGRLEKSDVKEDLEKHITFQMDKEKVKVSAAAPKPPSAPKRPQGPK